MKPALGAGFAGGLIALALTAGAANAQSAEQIAMTEKARAQLQEPARATTKMVQGAPRNSGDITIIASSEQKKTSTNIDVTSTR